ncbi:MAG: hypothetical protein GVY02_00980 [Bacteroidetes bacterium]|jgi:hypothetical protein|nr:hypothetical protein [Bacteroidota bacterium]
MKFIDSFSERVRIIENQWIPMNDGVRLAARNRPMNGRNSWSLPGVGPTSRKTGKSGEKLRSEAHIPCCQ